MTTPNLYAAFQELDSEDTFVGVPQTDFALDSVLETLPRELTQNTDDAREEGKTPQINFFFECLEEGDGLDEFKDAIDWDELEPYLEAVAEDDDRLGIQKVLDQIQSGELYVLGVEDVNAVGLGGDEDSRRTNYASLVKDFADSTKKQGGGVHGVGASVLWAFSGFKLVLFHSNPEDEDEPKLVGRLDLPDHELNGQEYKGGGWLGVDDGVHDRPVATRDVPDELAETLHVDRPDEHGTTALIVGFREPKRATRDPDEIVEGLYEAAARYYWPLIVDDAIEVTVQGPDDSTPRPVEPETVPRDTPYVEAYKSWEDPDDEFGDPGTVAVEELEFEVPPTESDLATTGTLVLVVRIAGDADFEKYRNDVAMFRGARHVVKYRDYGAVARTTGKEFHALLLAGGAKHEAGLETEDIPDPADKAIESFFRAAEPEAHDTWEKPTQKLANAYEHDNPSQLIESFLKSDVKEALQRILGSADSDDDERVATLGSEFPFFADEHGDDEGPGNGGGGGSLPLEVVRLDSWFDTAHHYEGEFELDAQPDGQWSLTVSIDEVDGSNRTIDQIDIATGRSPAAVDDPDPDSDGELTFEFDQHTTAASFELSSVDVGDEVLAGRTRLDFEYDLTRGGSS